MSPLAVALYATAIVLASYGAPIALAAGVIVAAAAADTLARSASPAADDGEPGARIAAPEAFEAN